MLLLVLPVFEYVFLRVFLKQVLRIELGWKYFTDFDLIFPIPMGFLLLVVILERKIACLVKLQPKMLALNLILFTTFLGLNFAYDRLAMYSAWGLSLIWSLMAVATIFTAFCSFVNPGFYFRNPNRFIFLPILLICLSTVYSPRILDPIWPLFSKFTGRGACLVMNSFGQNVECLINDFHEPQMVLKKGGFGARVGKGCGGLDSFFLLAHVMLILLIISPRYFSGAGWRIMAIVGAPLIYLLNVIRIVAFFEIALVLDKYVGETVAANTFLALFHSHAGWIIYCSGILLYILWGHALFGTAASKSFVASPVRERSNEA